MASRRSQASRVAASSAAVSHSALIAREWDGNAPARCRCRCECRLRPGRAPGGRHRGRHCGPPPAPSGGRQVGDPQAVAPSVAFFEQGTAGRRDAGAHGGRRGACSPASRLVGPERSLAQQPGQLGNVRPFLPAPQVFTIRLLARLGGARDSGPPGGLFISLPARNSGSSDNFIEKSACRCIGNGFNRIAWFL